MRQHLFFECEGNGCAATIDMPPENMNASDTGLLIISGGNEIRSGAHAGQADLAASIAQKGIPVFRYDRRGIGDSSGENAGFEGSSTDIAAAVSAFRKQAPKLKHIIAFGNCDAAAALALYHAQIEVDGLIMANPWVIDDNGNAAVKAEDSTSSPSSAAIRARYLNRLKDPRSIIDLFTGKISLRKLAGGLLKASRKEAPSDLAGRMAETLGQCDLPIRLLIARHDSTALAFMAAWNSDIFAEIRPKANIKIANIDSASHSFADAEAKDWLQSQILGML